MLLTKIKFDLFIWLNSKKRTILNDLNLIQAPYEKFKLTTINWHRYTAKINLRTPWTLKKCLKKVHINITQSFDLEIMSKKIGKFIFSFISSIFLCTFIQRTKASLKWSHNVVIWTNLRLLVYLSPFWRYPGLTSYLGLSIKYAIIYTLIYGIYFLFGLRKKQYLFKHTSNWKYKLKIFIIAEIKNSHIIFLYNLTS